jgi:hypothetical protein
MPVWLIQLVVGVVLMVASTLMQAATAPKPPTQQVRASGFRGTAVTGGDVPMSFVVGTLGLAGKLEYQNTYGDDGGTPNAYLVGVYSLSDLPITGCTGLFVNGSRVTKSASGHVTQGYPVAEYGGKLWWEFFDGTQTTANGFLTSAFGSDADRPWTTSMIGRGIAYVTMTALFDRSVWNGFPTFLFEVQGIPLYDVRKDGSAGGSGSHRLDDASTWEFSDNPIVAVYNILCGIRYGDDWVWGMQDAVDPSRLPYAVWAAAMDACDESVDLAGGGSEKRFRIGREISLDEQPADVIDELLVACNGRISEAAGIYTVVVGDPGEAAGSFTDDDVLITETQTLDPFPALDQIVNGATATYLEPSQAWESKEAQPYYRSDLEADDDGRRQLVGLTLNSVFSGTQVQRLLQSKVEESRRFYRHVLSLPPVFGIYRPLSVLSYTSSRNGYTAKSFLATAFTEAPNGNIVLGLQEVDPADHDWTPGTDEQPISFSPITTIRPPAQPMTGWTAAPYIYPDAAGAERRIGIEVTFTGGLPDVRAVRIQVREDFGDGNTVFDGEQAYDPSEDDPVHRAVTWAGIVPNTDYEVRGKFQPFSGRDTEWSDWIAVTTANIPPVGAAEIIAAAQSVLTQLGQVRTLIEQFKQIGTLIEAQDRDNFTTRQALSRSIQTQLGNLEASFTEIIEVALGPGGAIATALESLYAALGGNTSEVNVRWEAVAAPDGYSARYAIQAAVNDGTFRSATLFLDVPADTGQPTRIGLMAGQTVFFTSDGTPLALIGDDGVFKSANDVVQIDMINGNFSITVA